MTYKHTLYLSEEDDEKLHNWVEEMSEVYGSESAVLRNAVQYLKKEKGDELRELRNIVDDDGEEFV